MITVVKEFTFDAAHWLPGYNGPCSNLHGHRWTLQVGIQGTVQDGMVMDFSKLKGIVKQEIINPLDHHCLNEVPQDGFPTGYPTAENMVIWISRTLFERISLEDHVSLSFIRLYETPTSYAEWRA
jgi:6-pyruvoyltetrahydropterin/6-carboxytetrahydropterin synthase